MTNFDMTHEQIVPFVESWPVTGPNGKTYLFSSNHQRIWEVTIYKDGADPTLSILDHKPPVLSKLDLQGNEA